MEPAAATPENSPPSSRESPAPLLTNPNGAIVRYMRESDAKFIAIMQMEAFESKMLWAAGEQNMDGLTRMMTDICKDAPRELQNRILVAEVDAKPVGCCCMIFHGDPESAKDIKISNYVSCRALCGLLCFECVMAPLNKADSQTAVVEVLAVDASQRGKGIGNSLLEAAEIEARKEKCTRMTLSVYHQNRAKNLYNRYGFKTIAEKSSCLFWCGTGEKDFDVMEKKLT